MDTPRGVEQRRLASLAALGGSNTSTKKTPDSPNKWWFDPNLIYSPASPRLASSLAPASPKFQTPVSVSPRSPVSPASGSSSSSGSPQPSAPPSSPASPASLQTPPALTMSSSFAIKQSRSPVKHLKTIIPKEDEKSADILTTKENLLRRERMGVLGTMNLVNQPDITEKMRAILIDWLNEVAWMFKLLPTTIFATFNIVDAYLSRVTVMRNRLQLIGISSMLLASRYLEIFPAEIEDFVFIADGAFTEADVTKMAEDIFRTIGCNVDLPNEMEYIRHSSQMIKVGGEEHNLTRFITMMTFLDDFDVLPSVRVTAARYIACKVLGEPFVNIFEVSDRSIEYFVHKFQILFKNLQRSSLKSWTKFRKMIPDLQGKVKTISEMKFQRRSHPDPESQCSTYHEQDLKLVLVPEPVFEPDSELGEGTFGVVRRFEYKGVKYAVKQDSGIYADDVVNGPFLREVSLMQSLKHPNIVHLRHLSVELKSVFIDLGLCDLEKWVKDHGGITHTEQIPMAKQLLSALVYMHENGSIHRDLKPKNIIVFKEQGKIIYRISDLGASRGTNIALRDGAFTHEICTLWYRSPEILLGANVYGDRLDVWSMMCVLYQCATNSYLFTGDSEIDYLLKVFYIMGTPNEATWPGVTSMSDYQASFPQWQPQDDYFDRNAMLSDCYKDIINTGLIMNPAQRPRMSALLSILEDYENGKK